MIDTRFDPDNPILMYPFLSDFRNFLYLVWSHLGLPEPTSLQYEIASYLQHGPRRQVIEAYRGCGKSWITSAFVLWTLLLDAQAKFLVVSASRHRSDDFSTFTLRLIKEMAILKHLQPNDDQRNSKISFDVGPALPAHAPSVKSVGVFGQMAGSRATHIIADDVEIPNNSLTQELREKLLNAVNEFESIMMPEVGRITYLGTPQTEESIYRELIKRGYDARIWPARVPEQSKVDRAYGDNLAPSIQKVVDTTPERCGEPTDPVRFSHMELMEREASIGRSTFMLQFMLDTFLADQDRHPLKLNDLIIFSCNPEKAPILIQYGSGIEQHLKGLENVGYTGDKWNGPLFVDKDWKEYEGSVMAIDPSGRGADETTYAVIKHIHGYLYLLASGGFTGGYEDATLMKLALIAKEFKVNSVVVEDNFGDGMFSKLFQPVLQRQHHCLIEEVKQKIQKEMRIIDTLEPLMNRHKLIIDLGVVEKDLIQAKIKQDFSLFYQLTRITRDRGCLKHDDRLDVLAIAVKYWMDSLSRDEFLADKDYKEAELQRMLDEFEAHCLNRQAFPKTTSIMAGFRKARVGLRR